MNSVVLDFAINAVIGAAFATALALMIGWLIQQDQAVRKVLLAMSLLIVLVLSIENWRIYSIHGAWHSSIVYSILERGVPPEFALVAGETVQYHYAFHYLVAKAMTIISLAPPWFFAFLNVVSFVCTFLVIDRLAQMVDDEQRYRALAVTLAMIGFAVLINEPVGAVLNELFKIPDTSSTDVLHKFSTINNNQIGILFFVVASLGFAKLVCGAGHAQGYILMAIGYVGIGLFYPLLLMAYGIVTIAAIIQLLIFASPARYKDAALVSALLLAGALVLLPWVGAMSGNRTNSGISQIISFANLGSNAYLLLASLVIPAAVFIAFGGRLRALIASRSPIIVFLVLATLGLQAAFLLSVAGLSADLERKILTVAQIPLAIAIALPFRELALKHFRIFVLVFALLWLPVTFKWGPILVRDWPLTDNVTTSGISYVHKDPDQNELYTWILKNSDADAIFVDSYLTIPVFARRSLYLGVDFRRESGLRDGRDGWSLTADYFISKTNGTPDTIAEPRMKVVRELLSTSDTPLEQAAIRDARRHVPGRALFIVARDPVVARRLSRADPALVRKVFSNSAASIFAAGDFDFVTKSERN